MTNTEKLALRHYHSTLKLADNNDPRMTKMYNKIGWLTDEPTVQELLKEGYDNFAVTTANRIITDNGNELHLNKCPKCGRLTRTPEAQQCYRCGHGWHVE